MKKLLLAFMIIFAAGAFGMVYLEEGFESGDLNNVTVADIDGDGNNWVIASSPVNSGSYSAMSVSDGLTPDNELLFPSTYLELYSYLNFWIGGTDSGSNEHYEIYIANDDIDPSNFILVHEETIASDQFQHIEIALENYLLMTNEWYWDGMITVKVRHYNETANSAGSALVLDDFMMIYYPTFSYDEYYFIIPDDVVEPYSTVSMRWAPYDMTAYNYMGEWEFLGFDTIELHYIITDPSGNLQPEASIPMYVNTDPLFSETYLVDVEGFPMGTTMEYWCVAVDKSSSLLQGESQHFTVEWGEINFGEGFEYDGPEMTPPDGWMPDGWVSFQTGTPDDSHDQAWAVDIAGQQVHSGEYSCTSESQNNWGENLTVDYIVSRRLRVNGKPTLKYFMNADTSVGEEYTERWSVLISTVEGSGDDIENFVEIKKDSIIPTADNLTKWYEKLIYLGDYENEYVRIMWKHESTVLGAKLDRHLNLDDVSVAEFPVVNVEDHGNSVDPGADYLVTITATDYSGINNITVYYTVPGQPEQNVVLTDNGDDSFSGYIPGQSLDTRCSWYAVVTDDSAFGNTTTTETYQLIWFTEGVLEWGSVGTGYTDWPEPINAGDKVAMDWNFGTKANLYLNKIEIGWEYAANNISWRLVEFDEAPTENIFTDLYGVHDFSAGGDTLHIENGKKTPIYGHVGLVFETPVYNEIMLDESGDKSHAWQWNSVTGWNTNLWGAFYIKMYVSQIPNSIGDEFVSSTTELCQNYPNPFNPVTSINFYNRIPGNVELSVYNTLGEKVATLVDGKLNEGFNRIKFDASRFNSGVYYYTLRTPEKTITKKMLLVK